MKNIVLVAALAVLSTTTAQAGPIERACLQSDRGPSRSLCGCIQDVADMTLSGSDQRRAIKFFRDPHQAQVVRQSDRRDDEAFWKRYKRFGQAAASYCG
ncbi:hypothetical protein C8N32_10690 [Rhodovulum imhoffii]|uniref:HdeA/HdeB family protein n=2 Tax=Rhodovulum imhoffii TaxID=365340 RepID=A0A2T5BSZ3_9RHOB|nr:hypothetical protein [Rhodovulum imhoffii]MBK5932667.1 hypothetical protein [Rhodovulum imhoffii]PTN02517.1 hypothetical protein C8N32_10690 [Rhodovulum imhoffii]